MIVVWRYIRIPAAWFKLFALCLLAIPASCGKPESPIPTTVHGKMNEMLSISSYGNAEIALQGTDISFWATTEGESGIELKLADELAEEVLVSFVAKTNQPATLRLERLGEFTYLSAESQTQIVLGKNGFDAALIYSSGPFDASMQIVDIGTCDEAGLVCLGGGEVAFTPTSAPAAGGVLFQPLGATQISEAESGSLMLEPGAAGAEYGTKMFLSPELAGEKYIFEYEVPSNETALLRVNRNGNQRYHPANRSWARLWDDAQLVIYERLGEGFELADFNLVPCAADDWRCGSRKEFNALLPNRANRADLDYAIDLLRWATQHADYAMSPRIRETFITERLQAWEIYFRYYQQDLGGGYCGGTAIFFTRLLQEQGLDAFTWNFGALEDDLTHVTTILHVDGRFFMLDATFGTYFVEPETDAPLDVFELLSGAEFSTIEEPAAERDFLYTRTDQDIVARHIARGLIKNCETVDGAPYISCHYPAFGLQQYLNVTYPKLSANGYSNEPSALIDLMKSGTFGIGNMRNTDYMMEFASKLSAAGVPLIDSDDGLPPSRLLKGDAGPISP